MIARVLAVLFLATVALAAQSQPPAPCRTEVTQQEQQETANKYTEPKTEIAIPGGLPVPVSINPPEAQPQATAPGQDTEYEDPATPIDPTDWIIAGATVGLLVVAFFQLKTYRRQANIASKQAAIALAQKRIGDRQLEIISKQQGTLDATLAADKGIERAYIKVSPTLVVDEIQTESATQSEQLPNLHVAVRIENMGNTPATITGHLIQVSATDILPKAPPYDDALVVQGRAYLPKGDRFFVTADARLPPDIIEQAQGDAAKAGTLTALRSHRLGIKLYVLGYVDYIDKFNRRHRVGFGRFYAPERGSVGGSDNLSYILEPGYNYDRERKKDEGNDWDEPQE